MPAHPSAVIVPALLASLDGQRAPGRAFIEAYGVAESDPEVTVQGLGRPFVIVDPGLALKKFPCCYASHRAMDGLLALRAKLSFDAEAVDKVVCSRINKLPAMGSRNAPLLHSFRLSVYLARPMSTSTAFMPA